MRLMLKACAVLWLSAVLVAVPSMTASQTSRDVIEAQLENADRLARDQGYRLDGAALSTASLLGLLGPDGQVLIEVQLVAGGDYLIEGFCDEDCRDLDLSLDSDDGELVASDVEVDDVPELRFRPTRTGRHYLGVHLVDCSAALCFFAVRVLRRSDSDIDGR